MPSNDTGGRNSQNSTGSSGNYSLITKKILVLIKAAPLPSRKYLETVCTAGIDENRNWYRLYPIPFRYLKSGQWFKKYQWIKVDIQPVGQNKDDRKESFKPEIDTIKSLGEPLPAGNWMRRKKAVLPIAKPSIEFLCDAYKRDGTSLGMIKPKEILDFTAERDDDYWSRSQTIALTQLKLFGSQPKDLEKVPYKFYYHFICGDPRCAGHKLSIHDWEIYMLYLKLKNDYGYASDVILEKIKEKWFGKMWNESRDSYLFVGTVHSRYKRPLFVVLGVFWPPKDS